VSRKQDQARLIAERVARRLASQSAPESKAPATQNGTAEGTPEPHRARIINFVSASAPKRTPSSIGQSPSEKNETTESHANTSQADQFFYPQVAQSPWLAPFAASFNGSPSPKTPHSELRTPDIASHPSQERFGVDEAVVSELVEFFEAEKQCSIDPSGKPCDHCAMCSSRGF